MTLTEALMRSCGDVESILQAGGYASGDGIAYGIDTGLPLYFEGRVPSDKAVEAVKERGFAVWSMDSFSAMTRADDQVESRMAYVYVDLYGSVGLLDSSLQETVEKMETEAMRRGWDVELSGRPDILHEDNLKHVGLVMSQRIR